MLNGLKIVIGKLNDFSYDNANWSAATLLAAYGDWAETICFSVIGTFSGDP